MCKKQLDVELSHEATNSAWSNAEISTSGNECILRLVQLYLESSEELCVP